MSRQMKVALKRRYGQHFLRDTGTINRIVGMIAPDARDVMIEVGGGAGALSVRLAPAVARLIVVEIDREIAPALSESLSQYPNATVLNQDILQTDLPGVLSPYFEEARRLRIVGNLPYNIGTAVIERILAQPLPIADMVFMLQLEMVERICAAPGTREYGFFTVFCQHYCEVSRGFKVAPSCFVPRPKVYSAMVTLRPRARSGGPDEAFLPVVRAAFAYRRKKLVNSLHRDPVLGAAAEALLTEAAIDGARRAEDLSVSEYEHLASVCRRMQIIPAKSNIML